MKKDRTPDDFHMTDGDFDDIPFDLDDDDWEEPILARSVSLTVSESKRLIARGIARDGRVRAAMEQGRVAVCKGTTNAYIVEELLGKRIAKGEYCLGRTLPEGNPDAEKAFSGTMPDVVFENGEPVEGLTVAEAVAGMSAGDVVLKGANAISYAEGMAGVLIGHPEGGTMGTIMGHVYGKGLNLIVPVGLEKQIAFSPSLVATATSPPSKMMGLTPMWWIEASLYTEVQAVLTLAGVQAIQIASGGVCGAEGSVRLVMLGPDDMLEEAESIIEDIRGEPSFWDDAMSGSTGKKSGSGKSGSSRKPRS